MNRYIYLAVALVAALSGIYTESAGQGLYIVAPSTGRPTCAAIPGPATNQTWCFDAANAAIKYWNGSAYVAVGGAAAGVTSLNSLTGDLTIAGVASRTTVSTLGSTVTITTPQDTATSSTVTFASLTLTQLGGSVASCVQVNTTGALSRTLCSTGTSTPGGSTTQVQFNLAGAFAGNASFTFDNASGYLALTRLAGGAASCVQVNTSGQLQNSGAPCGGTGGSTSPGGSTTQVQFNNAGSFGGSASLTWTNTTGTLTASTVTTNTAVALSVLSQAATTGQIRFYETGANGGNYVGLQAPTAIASNNAIKLPSADGSAGQCLQTDGSGQWSFGSCSTGSITGSGAAGRVTYWTGTSTIAGSANLLWDDSNVGLTIGPGSTAQATTGLAVAKSTVNGIPVVNLESNQAGGTTATRTALQLTRSTTNAMGDGFGPRLDFVIRDNDATDNINTRLIMTRDGADNTSNFGIQTRSSGTLANRILIDRRGAVTFGMWPWIDVRYYGATGLGCPTDDTTAIQNAVNAAKAAYAFAAVYFPPGSYCVSSTIDAKGGFMRLFGSGVNSALDTRTGSISFLEMDGTYNEVSGLAFRAEVINVMGITFSGSSGTDGHNFIHGNWFLGTSPGIYVTKTGGSASEAGFDWNLFTDNHFANWPGGFAGNVDSFSGIIFQNGSGTGNVISNSNMIMSGASGGIGIQFAADSGSRNIGDILLSSLHISPGNGGTCLTFQTLAAYKSAVSINNVQCDGGTGTSLAMHGYTFVVVTGFNWGGGTSASLSSITSSTFMNGPANVPYSCGPTGTKRTLNYTTGAWDSGSC